ncbi:putative histone lysine methyltransferase, SET [Cardiosporidium cionae]|uniref:Histone lysine methyltransferase, SET n=1 Tax=Cardiosporidium cionae TaxID=476202 RepID=A0ABQ7JBK1_9APIC|nr:putative histone lysine methyltransferase, SET [Cardiosporidium cionae]|eukprot:KAF8821325.1 putative histone lysine methyltransferase, SET [Cardiosporidium cionae]
MCGNNPLSYSRDTLPLGFIGYVIRQDCLLVEDLFFQLLRNYFGNKLQRARHAGYQNGHVENAKRLNMDLAKPEFYFQHKDVRLRPSTVHGYGVFAAESIHKGDWIIEYVGLVVSEAVADKRFINHSCDPNCRPIDFGDFEDDATGWHVVISALRDIECGEELFYNYRLSEGALGKEKCFCGSPNCVGLM